MDNNQIIITTGDAEFAAKEWSRRLAGVFVGVKQYDKKEATPHFSFISKKAMTKSIEAISALTDPNTMEKPPYQS